MAGNVGKLAPRYARALLIAMRREGADEAILRQASSAIEEFARAWKDTKELRDFLLNPMFRRAQRGEVLQSALHSAGAPTIVADFLKLLFQRERLNSESVAAISDAFLRVVDEACSVVRVNVATAAALPEEEKTFIAASLSQAISGRLDLQWAVDPALLGGIVLRYQGKVFDGSLRGRIDRLESSLMR